MRPRYGPTVQWAGIPVTRVWRCGNPGSGVRSNREPARRDFLPSLDAVFSLQYSPLMNTAKGKE